MEIVLLQRTFLGYPLETRAGGKLQLNEWNSYHQLEKVWCEERIQLHNSVSNQDHTFQQLSNTLKTKELPWRYLEGVWPFWMWLNECGGPFSE